MKQFTHIRLLATAALALSIGLAPLSARADNGGTGAAAAAPSTAASAAAGQASTSPETDGVIVTLTNTAERELQSLGDGAQTATSPCSTPRPHSKSLTKQAWT